MGPESTGTIMELLPPGQRQLFFGILTAMFTFAGLVWAALTFLD